MKFTGKLYQKTWKCEIFCQIVKKWNKHTLSDESVFTVIFYRSKKKMIHIETHNNLNKILLLAVGLWPYQQSKFTQLQFIFFCTILSADIIFQVQNHIKLSYKLLHNLPLQLFISIHIMQFNFYIKWEITKYSLQRCKFVNNCMH